MTLRRASTNCSTPPGHRPVPPPERIARPPASAGSANSVGSWTNTRPDGARGGKISPGGGAPHNGMNESPPALDRVSSRDVGFRLARVKHWLGRQGPVRLLAVYFQSNAS